MIKMPEQEKEWTKRRADTLAADLDILLGDLCVIWGFCGGLTGWELTREGKAVTADDFAVAVIAADELAEASATAWTPRIRTAFIERYGRVVSDRDFGRPAR